MNNQVNYEIQRALYESAQAKIDTCCTIDITPEELDALASFRYPLTPQEEAEEAATRLAVLWEAGEAIACVRDLFEGADPELASRAGAMLDVLEDSLRILDPEAYLPENIGSRAL